MVTPSPLIPARPSGPGVIPPWPRPGRAILPLLLLMALLNGFLSAAEVTATLEPASIPAGEGATLRITVRNGNVTALNAPEVPNLIMQGPNQSRQMRSINGVTSSSLTLSYAVGSMTPGDYAIPPFTLTVDGGAIQTQPLQLNVTPSANQTPQGLAPGSTPPSSAAASGDQDFGFLTVELAGNTRKHVWVGEIAPVRIKAWIPGDAEARITSGLQPQGSSFTLHNVSDQPQQTVERNHGKQWRVLTWYGGLSAAKAGTYAPDLSIKATVSIPDPAASRGSRRGDPIFDRFFGRMVQKEVVLRSKTEADDQLEIRALPVEGRPDNFDGAVGVFQFGKTDIPGRWQTGEPQQISVEVTGSGNFALLSQPSLVPAGVFKSYPGQSSFTPGDVASFSGSTTFRFSEVARRSGSPGVHLSLSFFQPETGTYQTITTPDRTVEISGTDLPDDPAPASTAVPAAPPATEDAMMPLRTDDSAVAALTPLVFRPAFRTLTVLGGSVTVLGILLGLARRRRSDPQRRARSEEARALQSALAESESCAVRGDLAGFFSSARKALQLSLASRWQRPAPSITLADLTGRLPDNSPVLEFFAEADRQEYSRRDSGAAADRLPAWRSLLRQALSSLPPPVPRT